MPSYFVYILYSEKLDIFYRGQTNNVENRFFRHNAGLVESTKHGVPWIPLWYSLKNSRADSMLLERKLKNLSRTRIISFMLKYDKDLTSDLAREIIENLLTEDNP